MEKCSKCGRTGEPLKGGRIILGTVAQLRSKIMKCPNCGKLYCGACSEHSDAYGSATYKCPSCSCSLGSV